jgi:hypothetical protein
MNTVVFNDADSISGGGKQRRRSHGMKDTVRTVLKMNLFIHLRESVGVEDCRPAY